MNLKEIDIAIERIIDNIEREGFSRYDVQDIRRYRFKGKFTRYFFLVIEEFFPLLLRKILKIEKAEFVTAYSHVAEGLFMLAENVLNTFSDSLMQKCERGVLAYVENENGHVCWPYKENKTFFPVSCGGKKPTMPLHGLARCNILLLKLGKYYNNQHYIQIAFDSAKETMKSHNVTKTDKGEWYISYYYNSDDCTLNVNTEFAQWLAMLPDSMLNGHLQEVMNGIVRLLVNEQNEDGSWYYFSKNFMKIHQLTPVIDCHHTGTVLSNLMYVLNGQFLDDRLRVLLKQSINRGMQFYVDHFFDKKTGKAKTLIGYKRIAGPVQYAEAIFAFYNYLLSDGDKRIREEILMLFPKVIKQITRLVKKDGTVPSERILKWKNINSIRWGNGPVLQALACYKTLREKKILDL